MTIRINRIDKTSPSAKALADSLPDAKRLRKSGSAWRGKSNDLLINWGSSAPLNVNAFVANPPEAVARAADKLVTFDLLNNVVRIPDFGVPECTDDLADIATSIVWEDNYDTLMFRTTATGSGGEGIHVMADIRHSISDFYDRDYEDCDWEDVYDYFTSLAEDDDHWAPIFEATKFVSGYFIAKDEYRVHVFMGHVIHTQRKGLRTDDERPANPDFHIRNHANGFIFQMNDITPPPAMIDASVLAVNTLGLHFGAVDVRYNLSNNEYCILEVNSAPALTGTTLERYAEAFTNLHAALQEPS